MSEPYVKRIAVLITSSRTPMLIYAVYIDGVLTLAEQKELPKNGPKLMKEAIPLLARAVKAGFLVLVEEIGGQISAACGATRITLDTEHYDGRAVIVVAMERYRELKSLQMISFPPGEEGLFDLPSSIVDTEVKPNGESVYRINWEEVKPKHLLTLFCVYGTLYNNVSSSQFLEALCGKSDSTPEALRPFFNVVRGTDEQVLNQKHSTSPFTGKRLPNGDKVL